MGGDWRARAWNFLHAHFPDPGSCCQALLLCPSTLYFWPLLLLPRLSTACFSSVLLVPKL